MKRGRKTRRASKTQKVLDHLKEYGSITSWEAIDNYGATRLSAIIYNLRKHHKIESVNRIDTDKYGNEATYTKYIIINGITEPNNPINTPSNKKDARTKISFAPINFIMAISSLRTEIPIVIVLLIKNKDTNNKIEITPMDI